MEAKVFPRTNQGNLTLIQQKKPFADWKFRLHSIPVMYIRPFAGCCFDPPICRQAFITKSMKGVVRVERRATHYFFTTRDAMEFDGLT